MHNNVGGVSGGTREESQVGISDQSMPPSGVRAGADAPARAGPDSKRARPSSAAKASGAYVPTAPPWKSSFELIMVARSKLFTNHGNDLMTSTVALLQERNHQRQGPERQETTLQESYLLSARGSSSVNVGLRPLIHPAMLLVLLGTRVSKRLLRTCTRL